MKRLLSFLVLAFMAAALPASAQMSFQSGDLIKSDANPAVYYFGADGKRYVFPTERTYFTWYPDFSNVKTISTGALAAIPLGGNVTYKPGAKLVKITTDPKVYAVSKNGILRPIASESVAAALYGSDWNRQIDDLPDPFFVNYRVGAAINGSAEYDRGIFAQAVPNINVDRLLAASPATFVDVRQTSGFTPSSMTISPSGRVTWIALDDVSANVKVASPTTMNPPVSAESGTMGLGSTWSYTFPQTGAWTYQNGTMQTQTGSVTVQ